jgi:hypothetical protein
MMGSFPSTATPGISALADICAIGDLRLRAFNTVNSGLELMLQVPFEMMDLM